ncbi:MAG TPA: DnaA/Hda family protein [Phycisphaerales bacterium]|nr:DnaA/Hda family protein [Phycisphaerales bacterium]
MTTMERVPATVPPADSTSERICGRLAGLIGIEKFDRYVRDSARFELGDHELRVRVRSGFYADWLETKFGGAIHEAARAEAGETVSLAWVVDAEEKASGARTDGAAAARVGAADSRGPVAVVQTLGRNGGGRGARSFRTRHKLDDFVVGPSNRLGFEAVCRLASGERSGGVDHGYSTVFLHGECGVGKTHLLQGLAARFMALHPSARVKCVTGEEFTNEFIASVRSGRIESFRKGFRGLDLLCIDDVHFISGKEATQSEFLHTFDALDLGGARVALASDAHPNDIANLSARLVSRCLSGLVVRLERPDRATRAKLASALAARRGMILGEGAADVIADACAGSARDIEGALTRIEATRLLPGGVGGREEADRAGIVSTALCARALRSEARALPVKPVKAQRVVRVVAEELRVEVDEVKSQSRHRRVVLARSMAAHLSRVLTSQSFPEIARELGRASHSTIVAACQRIASAIARGDRVEHGVLEEPVGMAELFERLRQAVLRGG